METKRCFVCIEPDSAVKNNIALVSRELKQFGVPMNYVEPTQYHINLEFLGDVAADALGGISERWRRVSEKTLPFPINVRGISAFPNQASPRVVFAQCRGAYELERLGVPEAGPGAFRPHITIGRVKLLKGNFGGIFDKFGELEFGSFIAKEILLKESRLGETGAVHETIERFTLGKWQ
ncbi:MAG: RNA 2',3'-cyclic phosphodiesterase [archaeon]